MVGGNILLDANGSVKLCDFGVSRLVMSKKDNRVSMAGTWHFMPPELLGNMAPEADYDGFSVSP
jgi:serine/threonine protein kinase